MPISKNSTDFDEEFNKIAEGKIWEIKKSLLFRHFSNIQGIEARLKTESMAIKQYDLELRPW